MKTFTACLSLQLRLLRKKAPGLLAMVLAALLLSAAAAVAGSMLHSGRGFTGVTLVVATGDEDERIDTMLDLLSGLQDVSAFATVERADAQHAEEMVRSGQAVLAIVLPGGFFDAVLSGENLQPVLLVDASRPLEAMMMMKLAQSATRLLASAQQGITFALRVYDAQDAAVPERSAVVQNANLEFASFVLGKSRMFRSVEVSATGRLAAVPHYLLGAVLFFLMLCLPVLYRQYAFAAQRGWLVRLRAGGHPLALYALAQIAAGALAVLGMLVLLLLGAGAIAGGVAFSPWLLPGLLLVALCLSAFGFLCCNAGGIQAAVGLDFVLAAAMLLVGGGIVPAVLLPGPIAALERLSPLAWMRDALAPFFGGQAVPGALGALAALCAALTGGALLYAVLHEGRLKA